jgi:hypothetical protein
MKIFGMLSNKTIHAADRIYVFFTSHIKPVSQHQTSLGESVSFDGNLNKSIITIKQIFNLRNNMRISMLNIQPVLFQIFLLYIL